MKPRENYRRGTHSGKNCQLISVTNDHGEVAFSYDHAQRLIGEQQRHSVSAEGNDWTWQHQPR